MTSDSDRRDLLELQLGEQLHALVGAAHALDVRAAERFDASLQPAAFHLARWLYAYGPTGAAALADSLAMDRSSVSRLIKNLESRGYASKQSSPSDGRSVVVSLSDLGRTKVREALHDKGSLFTERLGTWHEADIAELTRLLARLNGLADTQ